MILSERCIDRLGRVHMDLQRVIQAAAATTDLDFIVVEGLRSEKRQAELVAAGASRTKNSRHLTGHAVDLAAKVGAEVRWDWPLYDRLAAIVKRAALDVGVPIEWGGDWKTFKDGLHFQLPRSAYP